MGCCGGGHSNHNMQKKTEMDKQGDCHQDNGMGRIISLIAVLVIGLSVYLYLK
ncbi:MAG: hypothetical protein ACOYVK_14960 [Bacillota bacterium]